jgi:hypothetical protein
MLSFRAGMQVTVGGLIQLPFKGFVACTRSVKGPFARKGKVIAITSQQGSEVEQRYTKIRPDRLRQFTAR